MIYSEFMREDLRVRLTHSNAHVNAYTYIYIRLLYTAIPYSKPDADCDSLWAMMDAMCVEITAPAGTLDA